MVIHDRRWEIFRSQKHYGYNVTKRIDKSFDFHHKLNLMQSELESIINSLMSRRNAVIMPLT